MPRGSAVCTAMGLFFTLCQQNTFKSKFELQEVQSHSVEWLELGSKNRGIIPPPPYGGTSPFLPDTGCKGPVPTPIRHVGMYGTSISDRTIKGIS